MAGVGEEVKKTSGKGNSGRLAEKQAIGMKIKLAGFEADFG